MTLQEGENVGPYRVISQLGQGGMATVYKAYHPQLDRYVALKMMHQAFLEDPNFLARFQREAQIVAQLEHPHIVPVYDFNEHKGQPYLIMKFIEGKTLKHQQAARALTLETIVEIMTAVAGALSYAHRKGVLHRDIKPSNIVIDKEGTPFLTDFGLARIAQAGESTMSTDMVLGTPHYISPEQAKGQKNLDGRTDIYSLGVVLYELTVGRVPFSADTPFAVIHDHIYTPLPLPSVVNPEISPAIEQVLLKALAKMPEDRFATADELMTAFRRALNEDRVTEIKPQRVNKASVTRAQTSQNPEEKTRLLNNTPTPVGVPAPVGSATRQRAKRIQPPEKKQTSGRRWMIWAVGGLLLLAAALAFAAVLRTRNTAASTQPSANRASELLLDIPDLSIEDAQATRMANPDDASSYLALAKAYWAANQDGEARTAITRGLSLSQTPILYLVNAAAAANEARKHEEGAAYITAADSMANAQNNNYNQVHALATQYLYTLAVNNVQLNIPQVVRMLNGDLNNQDLDAEAPLLRFYTTRQLIANGQDVRANLLLNTITDKASAEFYLLQGDLYQSQGRLSEAATAWTRAQSAQDAPDWIVTRATELLESIRG